MTRSVVHTLTVNSASYQNMVDVKGVSGTLTAVGVASGWKYHYVKIAIDGAPVVDGLLVGSNTGQAATNGSLGFALPFKKSLRVDVRDSPPSSLTTFWVTYVTSHTEQYGEPDIYLDNVEGQPFLRERAEFGTAETRYTVDRLLGPALQSEVQLGRDYYLHSEPIEGAVHLRARQPFGAEPMAWSDYLVTEGPTEVTLHVRPHGYQRTLDEVHVRVIEGQGKFLYQPADNLIHASSFDIVATLPDFMNIPAIFFRA